MGTVTLRDRLLPGMKSVREEEERKLTGVMADPATLV